MDHTPTKPTEFDTDLSLQIDQATAAFEEALERNDAARVRFALAWLRKLEAQVFGSDDESR